MTTQQVTPQDLQPKTLGIARWVQMAFFAFGLLLLFVLDRAINLIWNRFDEPQPVLVTAAALVVSAAVTLTLYRRDNVKRLAHEVVGELTKVTWPSRQETQVSTVVVIITSLIAAAIIGTFDAWWSWVTDFIYKV
jgi:preprotein translocase subunit SecE